jgi:hypothetical protein
MLPATPANPGPLPSTPTGPALVTGAASSFCFSHSLLLSAIFAVKSSVRLSAAFLLRALEVELDRRQVFFFGLSKVLW